MDPTLHSFGGSALDRLVFDFETSADGSAAITGAPAGEVPSQTAPAADPPAVGADGGETDPSAVATETAPAVTPEHLTAEDAAAIADARFQQLIAQTRGTQTPVAEGGEQVDLNQLLDPYGDNFGANLVAVFNSMLQGVTKNLDQRFEPFTQQAEQTAAAERDELLSTAITDAATPLGLKGGDAAVKRVMADVRTRYMPEAARVYGNTDKAAQVAIDRAVRAELDYQQQISGGAATESAEHLATLAAARTDLAAAGSGSGVVTFPNEPRSSRERVAAYALQLQGARNT